MENKRKKIWLGLAALLVLGILALLLVGRSENGSQTPTDQLPPAGGSDNANEAINNQGLTITSDLPARIAAVEAGDKVDLGTTPTSFEIDRESYWEIIAFDESSTKQQVIAKSLEPGQPLDIHFSFAGSRNWNTPFGETSAAVTHPLVENGLLMGVDVQDSRLRGLGFGSPGFNIDDSVESVFWLDSQNYAYLKQGGGLVLVRPETGWTLEGVKSADGNERQVAWINGSNTVAAYNWQSGQQTETGIVVPEFSQLHLGSKNVYLVGHDEESHDESETNHPGNWVDIYKLEDFSYSGRVKTHAPIHALAEIDHYSFWQVGGELYVVDTNTAKTIGDWGFIRAPVDIVSALDSNDQPVIYILNELGEIWDFNLDRQTYNLVGRAPDQIYWQGFAFPNTLVLDEGQLYFGFRLISQPNLWQTFRLRLASP